MTERVLGADLRIGDTIEVWWDPKRDVITGLRPLRTPWAERIFKSGASIADFALNSSGMTIDHGDLFTRIAKGIAP